MKLSSHAPRPMVLLTADDCRALARISLDPTLPARFQLFSVSLESDAVAIFQWKMAGRADFEGAALPASELAGLTLEDLLVLMDVGLSKYPRWRPIYRELATFLAYPEEGRWDWRAAADVEAEEEEAEDDDLSAAA